MSVFRTKEDNREGDQGDIAMPAEARTSFKLIYPDFVFQFTIVLLDHPAPTGR